MELTEPFPIENICVNCYIYMGAQWLSGRVLDSRPRDREFEPHQHHCFVSLSTNINPSLVLVQPRNIRPFIIERLLMGRKESNQTKQNKIYYRYTEDNVPTHPCLQLISNCEQELNRRVSRRLITLEKITDLQVGKHVPDFQVRVHN